MHPGNFGSDKICAARTIIFQRENLNYFIVCFTQCKLCFKKFVFIADLFAVRYLSVVCNEAKCMSLGLFTFVRIACLLQLWIKTRELDYSIWAPPKLKNMKMLQWRWEASGQQDENKRQKHMQHFLPKTCNQDVSGSFTLQLCKTMAKKCTKTCVFCCSHCLHHLAL